MDNPQDKQSNSPAPQLSDFLQEEELSKKKAPKKTSKSKVSAAAPVGILGDYTQESTSSKKPILPWMVGALVLGLVLAAIIGLAVTSKRDEFVISPPKAASAPVLSVTSGTGFLTGTTVYSLGGELEVLVDAPFYEAQSIKLTEQSDSTVKVELKPSPLRIKATVNEPNPKIDWYVDGKKVHTGEQLDHVVTVGTYTVKASSPYHEDAELQAKLGDDEVTQLQFNLTPVQGKISINSKPDGANLSINGKEVGQTNVSGNYAAGAYDVMLSKAGYEPIRTRVEVSKSNPNVSKTYELERVKGTLAITAKPEGGTLLLNGKQTPVGNVRVEADKTFQVVYQAEGYGSAQRTVSVQAGQTENISFELEAQNGTVVFKASEDAQIILDGKVIGTGTATVTLPTAKQSVEFKKEGFVTQTKTFTPNVSRTIEISAKMQREPAKEVAKSMGFQFSRIKMSEFTMGSPGNEPGRQRNEHQFQASFSRVVLIARHEVTEKQFSAFDSTKGKSNNPVVNVSWNEAALYANWLSEQDGLPAFYKVDGKNVTGFNASAKGYRLLSEAEWEWLAKRAGKAEQTAYVWGDFANVPANFGNFGSISGYTDKHQGVAPVGSYSPEQMGIHDLSGNVSEWVNDFHSFSTPGAGQMDYMGPRAGATHVVKGGHFKSAVITDLRGAKRTHERNGSDTIGFRLARYD